MRALVLTILRMISVASAYSANVMATNFKVGEPFTISIVISTKSFEHVNVSADIEGAKVISVKGAKFTNGKIKIDEILDNEVKVVEIKAVALRPVVEVKYHYQGFKGVVKFGDVKYPGTAVEGKVENAKAGEKRLILKVKSKEDVPITIEFPYSLPAKYITLKRCLSKETKTIQVDVCLKRACALSGPYGPLKCVRWQTLWKKEYTCIKYSHGKCVEYLLKERRVKECTEYRAKNACVYWRCAKWGKVPQTVSYCSLEKTYVLSSTVDLEGKVASFTAKSPESVALVYFKPEPYYKGPSNAAQVNVPFVTVYVGGTPYLSFEGTLKTSYSMTLGTFILEGIIVLALALVVLFYMR